MNKSEKVSITFSFISIKWINELRKFIIEEENDDDDEWG